MEEERELLSLALLSKTASIAAAVTVWVAAVASGVVVSVHVARVGAEAAGLVVAAVKVAVVVVDCFVALGPQ